MRRDTHTYSEDIRSAARTALMSFLEDPVNAQDDTDEHSRAQYAGNYCNYAVRPAGSIGIVSGGCRSIGRTRV